MAKARKGDDVWVVIYVHEGGIDFSVWNSEAEADAAARETMKYMVERADMDGEEAERFMDEVVRRSLDSALELWDAAQEDFAYQEKLWIEGTKVR